MEQMKIIFLLVEDTSFLTLFFLFNCNRLVLNSWYFIYLSIRLSNCESRSLEHKGYNCSGVLVLFRVLLISSVSVISSDKVDNDTYFFVF